jgi:hypothetical protein
MPIVRNGANLAIFVNQKTRTGSGFEACRDCQLVLRAHANAEDDKLYWKTLPRFQTSDQTISNCLKDPLVAAYFLLSARSEVTNMDLLRHSVDPFNGGPHPQVKFISPSYSCVSADTDPTQCGPCKAPMSARQLLCGFERKQGFIKPDYSARPAGPARQDHRSFMTWDNDTRSTRIERCAQNVVLPATF